MWLTGSRNKGAVHINLDESAGSWHTIHQNAFQDWKSEGQVSARRKVGIVNTKSFICGLIWTKVRLAGIHFTKTRFEIEKVKGKFSARQEIGMVNTMGFIYGFLIYDSQFSILCSLLLSRSRSIRFILSDLRSTILFYPPLLSNNRTFIPQCCQS